MMAEINLLPVKEKKNTKVYFLIFMTTTIIIIFISFILIYSASLKLKLAEIESEIKKMQDEIEFMEKVSEDVVLLENMILTYEQLLSKDICWEDIFDFISKYTPEQTWLSEILMHEKQYIMLKGYSVSLNEISVFISMLNNCIYFKSVRLSSAVEMKNGEDTLLNFEIICSMADKGE